MRAMKKSGAVFLCLFAVGVVISTAPAWALTAEQEAKLLASDASSSDELGRSVALATDTAVSGARRRP